ncbi:MAG: sigma-70 family RNA polymerase sigma factor [Candidatus Hinthialibacter antarcticus]|nr:sigma-70 family RNA polymerase sigma factor [Candidatus Hinthialibacter antarcticus]
MIKDTAIDPGKLFIQYRDKGDIAAFETVMETFHKPLFNFLLRMLRRQHEAEDALQEVWFKLLAQKDKYEDRGQFSAWLYRIAHNHCLDRFRKDKHFVEARDWNEDEEHVALIERIPGADPTPLDQAVEQEDLARLEQAVELLPPLIREVYLLRSIEEVPFKEIAEIQEAPLGTVLSRMSQAVKFLQKQLCADNQLAEETA